MAIPLLVPLAAVPVGLAVAGNASGAPPAPPPSKVAPNGGVKASSAVSPGSTIGDQLEGGAQFTIGTSPDVSPLRTRLTARVGQIAQGTGSGGAELATFDRAPYTGPIDAETQEKLDIINAYGEAAYNQMDDAARKAAAAELSKALDLNPPMDGSENWETIAKIAGGAAGVAAFGWLPGGAVWGPIVGAYLGVKLEELLSKHADEIKAWFNSKWAGIEGWVKDVAHDVEGWFDDIF